MRDDEITLVVARYILEKPLRVEDYPIVGSLVYELADTLEAVAASGLKPDTADVRSG